jgi:hypothetical protein
MLYERPFWCRSVAYLKPLEPPLGTPLHFRRLLGCHVPRK